MSPRVLVTVLLALSACGRIGFDPFGGSGGDDMQSDAGGTPDDGSDGSTDAATDAVTNGSWTAFAPAPPTTSSLWAIRAFSASDVWIGGTNGTILHHDGAGWMSRPGPTVDEIYMFGGSASDVWAVGRLCGVLRWNGTDWSPVTVPGCTNASMFAISGLAPNDQWIGGTAGTVLHWNGSSFTEYPQAINKDFWSVWTESANEVYLVGTRGTILHWTGGTFTDESVAQNVTLSSIWGTGNGEYWVVGAGGIIFHKVGVGGWTQVTSPTSTFLYFVHGTSATNVWAVGSAGVVLHYNGTQWSVVTVPTTVTLRAMGSVPGDGLRMVGDTGTMLTHP